MAEHRFSGAGHCDPNVLKIWSKEELLRAPSSAAARKPPHDEQVPSWPEGDWLPPAWGVAFRKRPCGKLHRIFVIPGEGEFLWHRTDVQDYLAGKTSKGTPLPGCTFRSTPLEDSSDTADAGDKGEAGGGQGEQANGGEGLAELKVAGEIVAAAASSGRAAPGGATDKATQEQVVEQETAGDQADATIGGVAEELVSPAKPGRRLRSKVAATSVKPRADLRQFFGGVRQEAPADVEEPPVAGDAGAAPPEVTPPRAGSGRRGPRAREAAPAPAQEESSAGGDAVGVSGDAASSSAAATARQGADLRRFFGPAQEAPSVSVAPTVGSTAFDLANGASAGRAKEPVEEEPEPPRPRPRFATGLLDSMFAKQKRKAETPEAASPGVTPVVTPERRAPSREPPTDRQQELSAAKAPPSAPTEDQHAPSKRGRPPASPATSGSRTPILALLKEAAAQAPASKPGAACAEAEAQIVGTTKRPPGPFSCGGPRKVPRQATTLGIQTSIPMWADRHLPRGLKDLRPKPAWTSLQTWLSGWERGGEKRKKAALLQGPLGSGKSIGARLVAQKVCGHVVEHHLGEKEGRAFLETILKRQQNCDQVLRNTVLIFDIPAEPSQDLRSRLCTAIQLSRSPVILVAGEGTLTSADSVVSHCLVLHLRMQTTTLCRIVQSVVQQEAGLEEAKTAAATEAIARSCAGDLRRALVAAQLLAPHGLGEAPPPWAAISQSSVCAHLLGCEPTRLPRRVELLAQGEAMPTALHERYLGGVAARSRGRDPLLQLEGCAAAAEALCLHDVCAVMDAQAAWAGGPDATSALADGLLLAAASAASACAGEAAKGTSAEWEAFPAPDTSSPVTWETCTRLQTELQLPRTWIWGQIVAWHQRCRSSRYRTEARFRNWIRQRANSCFRPGQSAGGDEREEEEEGEVEVEAVEAEAEAEAEAGGAEEANEAHDEVAEDEAMQVATDHSESAGKATETADEAARTAADGPEAALKSEATEATGNEATPTAEDEPESAPEEAMQTEKDGLEAAPEGGAPAAAYQATRTAADGPEANASQAGEAAGKAVAQTAEEGPEFIARDGAAEAAADETCTGKDNPEAIPTSNPTVAAGDEAMHAIKDSPESLPNATEAAAEEEEVSCRSSKRARVSDVSG